MREIKDSKGRDVDVDVHGVQDDVQIVRAVYLDDESDVSDDEVDYIRQTYSSELDSMWYDNQISRAESASEGDR